MRLPSRAELLQTTLFSEPAASKTGFIENIEQSFWEPFRHYTPMGRVLQQTALAEELELEYKQNTGGAQLEELLPEQFERQKPDIGPYGRRLDRVLSAIMALPEEDQTQFSVRDFDEAENVLTERRQEVFDKARSVADRATGAGVVGQFVGGVASMLADPVQAPFLLIGGPVSLAGRGGMAALRSIGRFAAQEAMLGAAAETASLAVEAQTREQFDRPMTSDELLGRYAFAVAGGGILGGAGAGLVRGAARLKVGRKARELERLADVVDREADLLAAAHGDVEARAIGPREMRAMAGVYREMANKFRQNPHELPMLSDAEVNGLVRERTTTVPETKAPENATAAPLARADGAVDPVIREAHAKGEELAEAVRMGAAAQEADAEQVISRAEQQSFTIRTARIYERTQRPDGSANPWAAYSRIRETINEAARQGDVRIKLKDGRLLFVGVQKNKRPAIIRAGNINVKTADIEEIRAVPRTRGGEAGARADAPPPLSTTQAAKSRADYADREKVALERTADEQHIDQLVQNDLDTIARLTEIEDKNVQFVNERTVNGERVVEIRTAEQITEEIATLDETKTILDLCMRGPNVNS